MALVNPNQPIHPKFDERISVRVEGQLPQFVKEDHATFVTFLEAYYEYMEQEGKPYEIVGNLNNYADLGKTTDDFLKYFKDQFAVDIPEEVFANTNKPFVLKHLRDFYRAKGSAKSFELFFRLLYNQEVELYFPAEDMLRTSDGRYNKSQIVRVIDTSANDNVFKLLGAKIIGQTSGAEAIVESVLKESVGSYVVSTIYLSGVLGKFSIDETISDGTYSFSLGSMITNTDIYIAGNNYLVGSIIPISGGGSENSGAVVKIKELTAGNIMKVMIANGGTGYVVGDKFDIDNTDHLNINGRTMSLLVKAVDGNGTITELNLENMGRGYTSLPTISGGSGTGFVPNIMGWDVGGIKLLEIQNNGFGFTSSPSLDLTGHGDGSAQATLEIGSYEPKYNIGFTGDNGFLSAGKYIQDSNYYQLFSYVVTVGETIGKWRDIVKRVIHPAGLALFGRYQLLSTIKTNLVVTDISVHDRYTIIFHDGTIEPPTRLNLKIDSCEGEIILVENKEDYQLVSEAVDEDDDFGLISEGSSSGEDYRLVSDFISAHIAPTKCQTYEQDLGIQYLKDGGFDDYLYVNVVATRFRDFGIVLEPTDNPLDYGSVMEINKVGVSQLRLGPIKRTLDRLKFNDQGGYSQIIGVGQQSGTTISNFKDSKISEYIFFSGRKHRNITNATISQYVTGDESNSLPPS